MTSIWAPSAPLVPLGVVIPISYFGAVGNGVVNDSVAIQRAASSGRAVDLNFGTFRVDTKILFATANTVFQNGTILWDGVSSSKLAEVSGANVLFRNITFDGNNKQPSGSLIWVADNTIRPRFHGCTIQNLLGTQGLTNELNNMYGIMVSLYGVQNLEIIDCLFKDFEKRNDGTGFAATVGAGFTGAVFFYTEDFSAPIAPQPIPTSGIIENCVAENIQTKLALGLPTNLRVDYDDADGIRFLGDPAGAANINVSVVNFVARKVSKRAVKVSVIRGANLDNITHDGRGLPYFPVTAVKLESGTTCRNVRCYSDGAGAPFYAAVEINGGEDVTLDGLEVANCTYGVQIDVVNNNIIKNLVLRGLRIFGAITGGVYQFPEASVLSHDQFIVENSIISCSGNTAVAIFVPGAGSGQGGFIGRNLTILNGEISLQGYGNELDGVKMSMSNAAYAGNTTASALLRVGQGLGTAQQSVIRNVDIDATGIGVGFLTATRPYLVLLYADRTNVQNLSLKVPEGLSNIYPHLELAGNDSSLDGYEYTGAGFSRFGSLVASSRWSVTNAKRFGSGACTVPFLTVNAAAQYYEFIGITDFRPTTATSVTSSVATNGIAGDIQTRSSNGTPASSGVAKTYNLNTF